MCHGETQMDCVYISWAEYTNAPSRIAYKLFRAVYRLSGCRGGMYGGVVPLAVQLMNATCGLGIARVQHHPYFDKAVWIAGADNKIQAAIARTSHFGNSGIDAAPAIYLLIDSQHAVCSETVPKMPVLAIQLERRSDARVASSFGWSGIHG